VGGSEFLGIKGDGAAVHLVILKRWPIRSVRINEGGIETNEDLANLSTIMGKWQKKLVYAYFETFELGGPVSESDRFSGAGTIIILTKHNFFDGGL